MSGKKKDKPEIVIPTEQEVAEFGGVSSAAEAPPPATEAPPAAPVEPQSESPSAEGAETTPAAGGGSVDTAREAAEWKDKFLRAKAELVNYQRRSEKDRAEAIRYAQGSLLQALLPIVDDLERVIDSGPQGAGDVQAILDGVRLTLENLLKVLREANVSRIEALGQPFDPNVHQAVMQRESDEHGVPTVLEELAKGYRLHDRVLRPAKVIVSKPSAPAGPEPAEQAETGAE